MHNSQSQCLKKKKKRKEKKTCVRLCTTQKNKTKCLKRKILLRVPRQYSDTPGEKVPEFEFYSFTQVVV